ncbi:MAG: hypothetical protein JSR94_15735, partial [Proteobacteria bacterium]|nr:hypothetical protein [Pseudomonadota bacterium]
KVQPEGNNSPTFMSFPLNGSAAAISRADDLCARYSNASGGGGGRGRDDGGGAPDDSDYFGGGGGGQPQPQPQPQRPKPRGDDSFF